MSRNPVVRFDACTEPHEVAMGFSVLRKFQIWGEWFKLGEQFSAFSSSMAYTQLLLRLRRGRLLSTFLWLTIGILGGSLIGMKYSLSRPTRIHKPQPQGRITDAGVLYHNSLNASVVRSSQPGWFCLNLTIGRWIWRGRPFLLHKTCVHPPFPTNREQCLSR